MIHFSRKLGINNYKKNDDLLIMDFLKYIEKENLDFTLSFRNLPLLHSSSESFYPKSEDFENFKNKWKKRVTNVSILDKVNPIYIPENHQVQKAIDEAYQGNFETFHQLIKVTSGLSKRLKSLMNIHYLQNLRREFIKPFVELKKFLYFIIKMLKLKNE